MEQLDFTKLKDIVEFMKSEGLYFSSDYSHLEHSKAYAILGGKTSVRYLTKARDNVNGIILFCAKDKEDRDRICSYFGKKHYNNGDEARPYKVQIQAEELPKVIELLKINERNILREN